MMAVGDSGSYLQLLAPLSPDSTIGRFLDKSGPGIQQMAYRVDDLDEVSDHLRGRLAGIEVVSYTTGPLLGNAESGIVAGLFGVRTSIVSGGVLCVAGTALLSLLLPQLIRYDGREGLARKRAEEEARADGEQFG
jgi:hypothetical protein